MRASSFFVAGLAVAIISIAPARSKNIQNAQAGKKPVSISQTDGKAQWKALTSYVACKTFVLERGWTSVEGWYGCNARNFKN
jgi:hypothetical protein